MFKNDINLYRENPKEHNKTAYLKNKFSKGTGYKINCISMC